MIFVVIGILILFASFIIALVSLVREQKNVEHIISASVDVDDVDEEPVKKAQEAHHFKQDRANLGFPQPVIDKHDEETLDERVDEMFPWERKSVEADDIQNSESDEIAQIEAQLNKIKVEKSQKSSLSSKEDHQIEESSKVQPKQAGKLSGGFTLRDLIDR